MSCPETPTTFAPNTAKNRRLAILFVVMGVGAALLTPRGLSDATQQGDVRGYAVPLAAMLFLVAAYFTWELSGRAGLLIDCQGITDGLTRKRPYTIPWENIDEVSVETRSNHRALKLYIKGDVAVGGSSIVSEKANRRPDGVPLGMTPVRINLRPLGVSAE